VRWRDVATELESRPGYRAAFEQQFPYANVALAVVALRERHGLTQRALAELVGTPQPVVARLESGRHPIEIKMLARIADAVGETWTVQFGERNESAQVPQIVGA
jgi:transcriptional regulator with XRE-family HTH domain